MWFARIEFLFSFIYIGEVLLKLSTMSCLEYWYAGGSASSGYGKKAKNTSNAIGESNRFDFFTSILLLIGSILDEFPWLYTWLSIF